MEKYGPTMVLLSIWLGFFFMPHKEDRYNHSHHSFTLTMFVAGFIFCYCCRPLLPLTYRNISHAAGTWHSGPSFRPGRRPSCLAPRRLRLQRTPPCRSSPGNVCWHRSWSTAFSCGTKESFGRGKHTQAQPIQLIHSKTVVYIAKWTAHSVRNGFKGVKSKKARARGSCRCSF